MANESTRKREADLLAQRDRANGNGGRFLREVSARELYEVTGHTIGAGVDKLRAGLDDALFWFKNATLAERVKVLGLASAVAVGGLVARDALEQETMTQGQEVIYLAQSQDSPLEQFSVIEEALEGYIQPFAQELYKSSLSDSDYGREAKQTLAQGIDGLITAGDLAQSGVDFDSDIEALAAFGRNIGDAQKAGLLSKDFFDIDLSQRINILAESRERIAKATQQLLKKNPPAPGLDR